MPKVLTEAQVRTFERDGCLSPVRAMSADRARHYRVLLLVEMVPTWARPARVRQAAMFVRGVDTYGTFDDEPRPDAEWSETALANWAAAVNSRATLIFEDSRIGPSEAYGGIRPAT